MEMYLSNLLSGWALLYLAEGCSESLLGRQSLFPHWEPGLLASLLCVESSLHWLVSSGTAQWVEAQAWESIE